ncbi:hypothetical protein H9Q69_014394, partial [Fusarium xylarioides]
THFIFVLYLTLELGIISLS